MVHVEPLVGLALRVGGVDAARAVLEAFRLAVARRRLILVPLRDLDLVFEHWHEIDQLHCNGQRRGQRLVVSHAVDQGRIPIHQVAPIKVAQFLPAVDRLKHGIGPRFPGCLLVGLGLFDAGELLPAPIEQPVYGTVSCAAAVIGLLEVIEGQRALVAIGLPGARPLAIKAHKKRRTAHHASGWCQSR